MSIRTTTITLALLVAGIVGAKAEKGTDLAKSFGKPTATDDIKGAKLGKRWQGVRGDWKADDGAIVGRELKADKHAGVLNFKQPNHNSAIQFSFKLDGAKTFHVSYNKKAGHLFRVIVTETGITVNLDKDKKDPKSKTRQLGAAKAKFEQGKWYSMLVTVEGANVSVTTDTGVRLAAKHADIDQAKPNYRFILRGGDLRLDDLKIWKLK
jgi:hypothetical protein